MVELVKLNASILIYSLYVDKRQSTVSNRSYLFNSVDSTQRQNTVFDRFLPNDSHRIGRHWYATPLKMHRPANFLSFTFSKKKIVYTNCTMVPLARSKNGEKNATTFPSIVYRLETFNIVKQTLHLHIIWYLKWKMKLTKSSSTYSVRNQSANFNANACSSRCRALHVNIPPSFQSNSYDVCSNCTSNHFH